MYSYGILKLHAALTRQTVENGRRAARISRTAIARGWATRALRITVWRFVYATIIPGTRAAADKPIPTLRISALTFRASSQPH
jgi:hypothetical protein